jgi:magnesium-transporting ATPase (P-type)
MQSPLRVRSEKENVVSFYRLVILARASSMLSQSHRCAILPREPGTLFQSRIADCQRSVHKNLRGEWKSVGDPTEVALEVFAMKLGLGRASLVLPTELDKTPQLVVDKEKAQVCIAETPIVGSQQCSLLAEFSFSSELKRMSVIYLDNKHAGMALCVTKGAVRYFLGWDLFYVAWLTEIDRRNPFRHLRRIICHLPSRNVTLPWL